MRSYFDVNDGNLFFVSHHVPPWFQQISRKQTFWAILGQRIKVNGHQLVGITIMRLRNFSQSFKEIRSKPWHSSKIVPETRVVGQDIIAREFSSRFLTRDGHRIFRNGIIEYLLKLWWYCGYFNGKQYPNLLLDGIFFCCLGWPNMLNSDLFRLMLMWFIPSTFPFWKSLCPFLSWILAQGSTPDRGSLFCIVLWTWAGSTQLKNDSVLTGQGADCSVSIRPRLSVSASTLSRDDNGIWERIDTVKSLFSFCISLFLI